MAPPGSRIRQADRIDDSACLSVIRQSFATVARESGFDADAHPLFPAFWTAERFAQARQRDGHLLVAEDEPGLVGCCFAGASAAAPELWYLKRLAVVPAARHLGIGGALVAAAVDLARANLAAEVAVRIIAANERLAAWYPALGFQRVGTDQPVGVPFEVAEYRRLLS